MRQKRVGKKQKNGEFENEPSFYKIIVPHPKISQRITIPPDFTEHIHKSAFKKATLRGPSGRCWPVKLHKNEKGVFVEEGWDRFFEDHFLRLTDFLIFSYDGETCFNVRIFGKNGLEKDISTQDDAPAGGEIKRKREEFHDAPPRSQSVPINGKRKRGRPRKNPPHDYQTPFLLHGKGQDVSRRGSTERIESSDEEIAFRFNNKEHEKVYLGEKGKYVRDKASGSKNKEKGKSYQSDELEFLKNPKEKKWPKDEAKEDIIESSDEEFPKHSKPNQRVRDSIDAKNNAFTSKIPCFEIYIDSEILEKKYVLTLPRNFAERYLPNKNASIILTNEKGISRDVEFNLLSGAYPRFYKGWVSFMRDNKLKLGDRCIFELVNKREMKVYISRSRESKYINA